MQAFAVNFVNFVVARTLTIAHLRLVKSQRINNLAPRTSLK